MLTANAPETLQSPEPTNRVVKFLDKMGEVGLRALEILGSNYAPILPESYFKEDRRKTS